MKFKNKARYTRLKSSSISVQYFERSWNLLKFTLVISESFTTEFSEGKVRLKLCWFYVFLIAF